MLNTGKISPEQMAYEIPEIWENDWFGLADETRVREFCNKIPDDAKSILDVGCGSGLSGQVSSVSSTLRKSTLITLFAVDVDDIWNVYACYIFLASEFIMFQPLC